VTEYNPSIIARHRLLSVIESVVAAASSLDTEVTQMSGPNRKEQLERRLEQSRRLLKSVNDPTTAGRLRKLVGDLEQEKQQESEK
jgi:hypothetical protein